MCAPFAQKTFLRYSTQFHTKNVRKHSLHDSCSRTWRLCWGDWLQITVAFCVEWYVPHFSSLNLIKTGVVELQDLKLKRTAFDAFDIPVVVLQGFFLKTWKFITILGFIGKLHLNIPWSSLQSSPVVAEVSDVYLLVTPKKNLEVTPEDIENKNQLIKRRLLDSYETTKAAKLTEDSKKNQELTKDKGFMSKLIDTVVNNVQISIHNVHVRYEDVSSPGVCIQKTIF